MRWKINPAVLQAKFENEQILVQVDSGRFFRLNPTAARLYELLASGNSLECAREILLTEYDVRPEVLDRGLRRLVNSLHAEGLLLEAEG